MSTILEGVEKTDVSKHADILVASETLHKIANAVFKETLSWKLRAYHENIEGRQIIVLCDDDFEEIELFPLRWVHIIVKILYSSSIDLRSSLKSDEIQSISLSSCVKDTKREVRIIICTEVEL